MTTATIFHGLYQGEHGELEDANLVAVFSTHEKAAEFMGTLSNEHTELKRELNLRRSNRLPVEPVPDLYWDIRPVAFDPRVIEELL